jgi:hypothetical protein
MRKGRMPSFVDLWRSRLVRQSLFARLISNAWRVNAAKPA